MARMPNRLNQATPMKTLPPCDHDECPPTRCIQNANAKTAVAVQRVVRVRSWRCQFGMNGGSMNPRCEKPATLKTGTGYKCCASHAPYWKGKLRDDVKAL